MAVRIALGHTARQHVAVLAVGAPVARFHIDHAVAFCRLRRSSQQTLHIVAVHQREVLFDRGVVDTRAAPAGPVAGFVEVDALGRDVDAPDRDLRQLQGLAEFGADGFLRTHAARAFGAVDDHAVHHGRPAVAAGTHLDHRLQVAHARVGQHDTKADGVPARLTNETQVLRSETVAVLGVNALQRFVHVGRADLGLQAEQAEHVFVPNALAGAHVALEQAESAEFLNHRELVGSRARHETGARVFGNKPDQPARLEWDRLPREAESGHTPFACGARHLFGEQLTRQRAPHRIAEPAAARPAQRAGVQAPACHAGFGPQLDRRAGSCKPELIHGNRGRCGWARARCAQPGVSGASGANVGNAYRPAAPASRLRSSRAAPS